MKLAALVSLILALSGCTDPPRFTATVETAATTSSVVGGTAQLLVKVTNTGPAIPQLGLVFTSADKWYEHHTVSDAGGCTVDAGPSAFRCGDLPAGASASFLFVGVPKDAGTFHYEMVLKELVQPFDYVNDHPNGADTQTWDEIIALK